MISHYWNTLCAWWVLPPEKFTMMRAGHRVTHQTIRVIGPITIITDHEFWFEEGWRP